MLIANAGGTLGGRALTQSRREDWAATFGLNVLYAVDLLREAVPVASTSDAASAIFVAFSGRAPTTSAASMRRQWQR